MSAVMKLKLTMSEYLKGELLAEDKHEFIEGEAYAMAGASADHNRISGAFYTAFLSQLKGRTCEPFMADMKVKTADCCFYPDVMIVCDDHQDDTEYVKNAPKLIVEVLSKSTRFYDHSTKQKKYLAIDSLEYYILVEQEYCEVCVLSRSAGFIPQYYTLGDEIEFPLIPVSIAVNDIYDRINNDDKKKYLATLLDERSL
ncbi:Uma2 family endonuclease [Psychromonas hadalis]|uniref:Uma2 family endonuclease n=1 Tax=Psychromonas hadalis TaxID=211669 RepID=UPI0003B3E6F8|nr:Uma2 family endonuclease [Psychromonas hadalis]